MFRGRTVKVGMKLEKDGPKCNEGGIDRMRRAHQRTAALRNFCQRTITIFLVWTKPGLPSTGEAVNR